MEWRTADIVIVVVGGIAAISAMGLVFVDLLRRRSPLIKYRTSTWTEEGEESAKSRGQIAVGPRSVSLLRKSRLWLSSRVSFSRPHIFGWVTAPAMLVLAFGGGWFLENWRTRQQLNLAQSERSALEQHAKEQQQQQLILEDGTRELQKQVAAQSEHGNKLAEELKRKDKQIAQLKAASTNSKQSSLVLAYIALPPVTMHGDGKMKSVFLPTGNGYLQIQIGIEGESFRSYSAEIRSDSNAFVWRSDGLKARIVSASAKAVMANISANLFRQKVVEYYDLKLEGITNKGESKLVGTFSFQVVTQ
jgi:hypothetical protein